MALYMKKRKGDRVDPQQQMPSPLTPDWAMKKPPPPTTIPTNLILFFNICDLHTLFIIIFIFFSFARYMLLFINKGQFFL